MDDSDLAPVYMCDRKGVVCAVPRLFKYLQSRHVQDNRLALRGGSAHWSDTKVEQVVSDDLEECAQVSVSILQAPSGGGRGDKRQQLKHPDIEVAL